VPDRRIKEQINSSESLSHVSEGAELLFRQLLHYVDANGYGDARTSQIIAGCCPLRRRAKQPELVEKRLAELVAEGCVELGCAEDGRPRLRLTGWPEHQKQPRGRGGRAATLFPSDELEVARLAEELKAWWEGHEKLCGPVHVDYAIETCRDWSHGSGRKRARWFSVLCNGVRSGWLRPRGSQPRKVGGALSAISGGKA